MSVHRIGLPGRTLFVVATCLCSAVSLPLAAQAGTSSHSRYPSSSRAGRAESSRGVLNEALPLTMTTGQVGQVVVDNAPIIADRADYGRLLSRCASGADVIVIGETDAYYAVEMADHSLGYILKSDVHLLPYQVTLSQQLSPLQQNLIHTAAGYLQITPYVYGGDTKAGIDCSGLMQAVFEANGMKLPRTAHEQANVGYAVPTGDMSQWQPGDRLYFQCHHDYIDHTGMYIGNGFFIQSSIDKDCVNIMPITGGYYRDHLVAVRRSPELVASDQASGAQPSAPDYEASQE